MNYIHTVIYIILFVLAFHRLEAQAQDCMDRLNFFIGEWKLETYDLQPDGRYRKGFAKSKAYLILDAEAMQDDFKSLNAKGEVAFHGTSIRSCLNKKSEYIITWIMPGKEGLSDLRAVWNGGTLNGEGEGYDDIGEFEERFTYFNISDSSYSFRMHRSYDGGKTWLQNFSKIEAKKKQ